MKLLLGKCRFEFLALPFCRVYGEFFFQLKLGNVGFKPELFLQIYQIGIRDRTLIVRPW